MEGGRRRREWEGGGGGNVKYIAEAMKDAIATAPPSVGVGGGGANGAYTSETRERVVNVCVFMRALSASGRQYSEPLRATCCRGSPTASRMERQRPARASRAPALGDLSFRDSSSLMPLEVSQWTPL